VNPTELPRRLIRITRNTERCAKSGKKAFRTQRKARMSIERMEEVQGSRLYPYRCRDCGLWHMTSSAPRQKVSA